jgi:hypothetical protein
MDGCKVGQERGRGPSSETAEMTTTHKDDHRACVNAWMARAAKDDPAPERLIEAFEQAFAALWRRAHRTLGDVTLMAIVDRVLYNAAEGFPFLSALKIEATGLRCPELRQSAGSSHHDQLAEGLQFLLVEFLTVLGNLTAEVLTPALHSELSKVALEVGGADEKESRGEGRNPPLQDHEKAK